MDPLTWITLTGLSASLLTGYYWARRPFAARVAESLVADDQAQADWVTFEDAQAEACSTCLQTQLQRQRAQLRVTGTLDASRTRFRTLVIVRPTASQLTFARLRLAKTLARA